MEIDNDANLVALAELRWGMRRDCNNFAYIKVATGIGAGLVVDGKPCAAPPGPPARSGT